MEVAEAAVAVTVANGLPQAGLPGKHRLHGAVLGKDRVPGSPVPVHLAVIIVAVQTLCGRRKIVVRLRGNAIHRDVCRRKQSDYLRRYWINRDGRLVGKSCPAGAVRVPRVRVIDCCPGTGEISGTKSRRRESLQISTVIAFKSSVVTSKEEHLVLDDWATERAT